VIAAVLPHTLGPYLSMMVIGFIVATVGHIWKVRWLVVVGIAMIFLATLFLPLALIATNDSPPTPPGNF
jgi:hypothetical protein